MRSILKFFFVIQFYFNHSLVFGQGSKPIIDTSVCDRWPAITDAGISNNGAYAWYKIYRQPMNGQTLVFVSTDQKWEVKVPFASNPCFTADSWKVVYQLPGDTLALMNLKNLSIEYIPHVKSYKAPKSGVGQWLVYQQDLITGDVVLYDLQKHVQFSFSNALDYALDENGEILLVHSRESGSSNTQLEWVRLHDGKKITIWEGARCLNYVFAKNGRALAFMTEEATVSGKKEKAIWKYDFDSAGARMLLSDTSIKKGYSLSSDRVLFNKDGDKLFLTIQNDSVGSLRITTEPGVDIWNYKDRHIQERQMSSFFYNDPRAKAMIDLQKGNITYLSDFSESLLPMDETKPGRYKLVVTRTFEDYYYNLEGLPSLYLVSTEDGSRRLLGKHFNYSPVDLCLSPKEDFVLWFDRDSLAYFSYEIATGVSRNLSILIKADLYDIEAFRLSRKFNWGVAGWSKDGRHVFFYDQYDLWKCDLAGGEAAINVSRGIGREQGISFAVVKTNHGQEPVLDSGNFILLDGFSPKTKANGFWKLKSDLSSLPVKGVMDNHSYYIGRVGSIDNVEYGSAGSPIKAAYIERYLVWRMSAAESPNLFITNDFKTLQPISAFYPERAYNWLKAELVSWPMNDGRISQGVLYKPENFDSTKKYPLLFDYYVKRSDELNAYFPPVFSQTRISIPFYVSSGYLVFTPDIYYTFGHNGESVLNSVVSAAHYLAKLPFVDSTRMGLQGHSFGGWETNYLVTHSNLFAAACAAAGLGDQVSAFGQTNPLYGLFNQRFYEVTSEGAPYGVGNTPWTNPRLYIDNSPIFQIDRVTTPLLMFNCKKDGAILFEQAMEMYSGMVRAGKKVWLLQYDRGVHGVLGDDARDYTLRMKQFFDYYLMGAPPPVWMTKGVPAVRKGKVTGLELDKTGVEP